MSYGKRIDTLCSLLEKAEVFADIGCDHGYCTEYMLKNALCKHAIFSDVSKGSLEKAKKLLVSYVEEGRATPVLGDGFYGVKKDVDEVLIAGMGGCEIIAILSDKKYGFMPKRFVFQPMLNADKLRRYVLENGGYIERDFTFEDGKFYDVIVGGKKDATHRTPAYSEIEYEFGRENLQTVNEAFKRRTKKQIAQIDEVLKTPNLKEESKEELLQRKERLQGALQSALN